MTTLTAVQLGDTAEFDADTLAAVAFGDGTTTTDPNAYIHAIGAIDGHCAWTWACGADLAQWGAFRRGE